jgi:hypothetical protein
MEEAIMAKYEDAMTLEQVLDDPDMKSVVLKHMPNVESNPMIGIVRKKNIAQIRKLVPDKKMQELLDVIITDLKAL